MKRKTFFIGLAVYFAVITLAYLFKFGGDSYFSKITNIITVITPFIPLYFGFLAVNYFGLSSQQGKSVLLIVVAIISWWIGDVIWWLIAQNAVVSAADIFWLIGYVFFIAGICYNLKIVDSKFFKSARKVMYPFVAIFFGVFVYFRFFPLGWDYEAGLIQNLATGGYVIADFILLIGVLVVAYFVYLTRKGQYSKPWIAIGGGMLLYLIGDIYYTVNYGAYKPGNPIELLWLYAYVLFGIGFFILKDNVAKIIELAKHKDKAA